MSRQIQFCHNRCKDTLSFGEPVIKAKGGRTVVMEKISLAEFNAAIPSLGEIALTLKVGVALCSKKDNYDKSKGRELALSRMKDYNLFVTMKSSDTLQLYNAELRLTLILKKSDVTDDINFINVV